MNPVYGTPFHRGAQTRRLSRLGGLSRDGSRREPEPKNEKYQAQRAKWRAAKRQTPAFKAKRSDRLRRKAARVAAEEKMKAQNL
jgi:hypothetical protein